MFTAVSRRPPPCLRSLIPRARTCCSRCHLADGIVAHLRHRGLALVDSATEPFGLGSGFVHRATLMYWVIPWMCSRVVSPPSGRSVDTSRFDVEVFLHASGPCIPGRADFPAEQSVVELLCAVEVVGRDFKPDQASDRGIVVGHCLCAHVISFLMLMKDAAGVAASRKLELALGRG